MLHFFLYDPNCNFQFLVVPPGLKIAIYNFGWWTMRNLLLQFLVPHYTGQVGQIQGDIGDSRVFPITAGVRQGCVLSPRLFTAILQWAMQKWRQRVENSACGIDLEDGGSKLLDLRFADEVLLFARSKFEAIFMLETLMEELAYVGLCLNAGELS